MVIYWFDKNNSMNKIILWVFLLAFSSLSAGCLGFQKPLNADKKANDNPELITSPTLALKEKGLAYLVNADYAQGHVHLEQAFRRDGTDPETLLYLGLVNEVLARPATAIRFYERYTTTIEDSRYRKLLEGRFEWLARALLDRQVQSERGALVYQPELVNVGVLPVFTNSQVNERTRADQLVFVERLAAGLDMISGVNAAERIQTIKMMQHFNVSEFPVSSREALQMGKVLGVEWVIALGFNTIDENQYQITCLAYGPEGNTRLLYEERVVHRELIFAIREIDRAFAALAGITAGNRPEDEYSSDREAILSYGKGLMREDNGAFREAYDFYKKAVDIDPDFLAATIRMNKMEKIRAVDGPAELLIQQYLQHRSN